MYFLLIRVFASQQSACGKTFWLPKLELNCWVSDLHLCILKQGQWNKPNTHRTTIFGDHKLHSMLFLQLQQSINDGSFLICNAVGCNDSEAPSDSSLPALGKQLGQLAGVSTFLYLYFYSTFSSSASADAMISLAHWLPFRPSYFRRLQKKMLQISLCLPTHIVHLMYIKHIKKKINYAVSIILSTQHWRTIAGSEHLKVFVPCGSFHYIPITALTWLATLEMCKVYSQICLFYK